ncbi:hypothetical protein MTP06_15500 [Streptomyces sp. PLM4]|uniref:Uncharacterized protein n=1 Tax=Streptomyces albidoflavus TaxID=1886 RepID=A0AA37C3F4_9ACTN|nr:hypothetical protein MTP02_45500 [Streptomyces albus]BDH68101.1 hypothetical protein MTP06_15500 [Streptomyces sp. PLM4]GHI48598.1 hypothetical protein ScoT_47720 [Streptomyces albidoflavus]
MGAVFLVGGVLGHQRSLQGGRPCLRGRGPAAGCVTKEGRAALECDGATVRRCGRARGKGAAAGQSAVKTQLLRVPGLEKEMTAPWPGRSARTKPPA